MVGSPHLLPGAITSVDLMNEPVLHPGIMPFSAVASLLGCRWCRLQWLGASRRGGTTPPELSDLFRPSHFVRSTQHTSPLFTDENMNGVNLKKRPKLVKQRWCGDRSLASKGMRKVRDIFFLF